MKNNKGLFIAGLLAIVLVMSVGYATFSTDLKGGLNMNGKSGSTEDWNVVITNIEVTSVTGDSLAGNPTFNNTSATFDADLSTPGDSITYTVTIENKGTIDATLAGTTFTEQEDGSPAIIYSHTEPTDILEAGTSTTMTVTATYDESYVVAPDDTSKMATVLAQYTQAG